MPDEKLEGHGTTKVTSLSAVPSADVEEVHTHDAFAEYDNPTALQDKPAAVFEVRIDKSAGRRMGLAVKQNAEVQMLQIMSVEPGDTAAFDWNEANPEVNVRRGDFILSVNDRENMAGIVFECKKPQMLVVRLQRSLT